MKKYLITILTRKGILVDKAQWKAESMEHAEKQVNDYLYEIKANGEEGKQINLKTTEEKVGNNIKWLEVTSQFEEKPAEVFFVSLEEERVEQIAVGL